MALFSAAGEVSPNLDHIVQLLSALDAGFQTSAGFFAALLDDDLLEPLTLNIAMVDESEQAWCQQPLFVTDAAG